LTFATTPNEQEEQRECNDKEGVERALLGKQQQAQPGKQCSTHATATLADLVGPRGTGLAAGSISDGLFVPPAGTDKWAAKPILHPVRPLAVQEATQLPNKVAAVADGWRRAWEMTLAGQPGLTFSQFKAQASDKETACLDAAMVNAPSQM